MTDVIPAERIAAERVKNFSVETPDGAVHDFMLEHPDGLYIHLPNHDYLADWALSYSAMKTLNSNPPDWWWDSPFNVMEEKESKSSPALRLGSALHCALLEPEGELEKRFSSKPSKDDPAYKGYLRLVDDLKKEIKSLGVTPKGKKAELIAQLLELDPAAKILDVEIKDWQYRGQTELTPVQFRKVRLMKAMAEKHPALHDAFTGVGLSEVSVFSTIDGVRQRARFDRLKPRASIDLKSFSNWQGRDFRQALLREASMRDYPVQAVHYDVMRHEARRLMIEGKIYFCEEVMLPRADIEAMLAQIEANNEGLKEGEEGWMDESDVQMKKTVFRSPTYEERALVYQVLGGEEWSWVWVFYKTDGAPTAQPVRMDRLDEDDNETLPYRTGRQKREQALRVFKDYDERFGLAPGQMWLRTDPMWTPDDGEWPAFMEPRIS